MNTFTALIMKANLITLALTTAVMLASCGKNESPSVEKVKNPPSGEKSLPAIVIKGRNLPIKELETVDLEKSDPDELTQAVKQIGLAKKVESVPFLVANVIRISPVHTSNAVDFAQTYPCSAALVEIGESAVPQIQARLLTTGTNIEQMVLVDTLRRIKGNEYVAIWLDGLPDKSSGSLPEQRRTELKQWALSQTP